MIGVSLAFGSFIAQFPGSEGWPEDLVLSVKCEMKSIGVAPGEAITSVITGTEGSWLNPVPFLLALHMGVLFGGIVDILHCQYTMLTS